MQNIDVQQRNILSVRPLKTMTACISNTCYAHIKAHNEAEICSDKRQKLPAHRR